MRYQYQESDKGLNMSKWAVPPKEGSWENNSFSKDLLGLSFGKIFGD